jgi:glucose/arabinose dehydrogenase
MIIRNSYSVGALGVFVLAVITATGFAQSSGRAPDQAPGTQIKIDLADLAKPYATPAKASASKRVRKSSGATLTVPEGFTAMLFADGLDHARNMKVTPNGDVLLAESSAGKVTLLRDVDGDGKAETIETFASGFTQPYGLDIAGDALYVGDRDGVWRVAYSVGDTKAQAKAQRITPDGAFGRPGGHWTRNVAVSPDGTKIYVAIGSAGNIDVEDNPRATIQVFNIDGSGQRTFASGLRNPVGLDFYPGTNDLYTVVNERDGLGDELVPDYLTKVQAGGFYGWPYSYFGSNPQPGFADKRPDLVASAIVPDLPIRSHSAPLGMAFYDAGQFPEKYIGGAFIALHGSWNASEPRAYNVVYAPFENGKSTGSYVVFASGFWTGGSARAEVWGRPADVVVAKDGSLLIADDVSSSVWRVTYTGN